MRTSTSQRPPRWQDDGLSISFRSCQLQGLVSLHDALATAQSGDRQVVPGDVMHLDVAENEVELTVGLQPFTQLLSLDISHNNVEELTQLPIPMLHLNASYNRVQSVEGASGLTKLVELNLGYNLITSLQPLERLPHLQVLLVPGNRIGSLHGLSSMCLLECLDLKRHRQWGKQRAASRQRRNSATLASSGRFAGCWGRGGELLHAPTRSAHATRTFIRGRVPPPVGACQLLTPR